MPCLRCTGREQICRGKLATKYYLADLGRKFHQGTAAFQVQNESALVTFAVSSKTSDESDAGGGEVWVLYI